MLSTESISTLFSILKRSENAEKYIEEAAALYPGVEFRQAASPEDAARESDIIVCATLANTPIIQAEWLRPGCLLMNLADYEVTYDCVRRASKLVVDNWETVKHRQVSTISLMWRDGLVKDEDIHAQLGEILLGKKPGRENDDEIIYFNAVGTGILDLAVATRCYRKALELGIGTRLPFWV